MNEQGTSECLFFEGYRLDRSGLSRLDSRAGAEPVPVGSRALDLLWLLAQRPGEVVAKDTIIESVWRAAAVEESNLTVQVSALRRVLDQGRANGSCIQTIPGRGYRFIPSVSRSSAASPNSSLTLPDKPSSTAANLVRTAPRRDLIRLVTITALVSAALVIAIVGWWAWPLQQSPTAGTAITASTSQPIAPRLSIVVLPFANPSNDPDLQYIADGITEDLTIDLSRLAGMLVISHGTAFTYLNKSLNSSRIAREVGVRYVLEGSVRRLGSQLRVNAQLIDAKTGAHLWAERFDRDTSDLFALQNEITSRIAVALDVELVAVEAAQMRENPDALDYILRARAAWARPPTRENYAEVIGLFERALATDPSSIEAQSWLAWALSSRVLDGKSDSPTEDLKRAESLLLPALAASPRNPILHYVKGQLLRAPAQGSFGLDANARVLRYADAIPEYEFVLAANPNDVKALAHLGFCKMMIGALDGGIQFLEKAIRLSPRDPYIYLWATRIGFAHLLQSRIDESVAWLETARRNNSQFAWTHWILASVYGLKNEFGRAAAEFGEARQLSSLDWKSTTLARVRTSGWNTPPLHERFENTLMVGLRKAGLPEE
jgi:adenylate cyclase